VKQYFLGILLIASCLPLLVFAQNSFNMAGLDSKLSPEEPGAAILGVSIPKDLSSPGHEKHIFL